MANQYENYLNRLRNIKLNRPEMKVYERSIQSMSQPFNILNRKMASLTQRGGASTASQVAALNEGRSQWNNFQREGYNAAINAAGQREQGLDMEIARVEMQNDAFKEQESKEKAAKRTAALRTGLQVGGMALGALLAAPTGGMSLLAGASLGGAIGQTASGFMGIGKDGQLTADPEEWDVDTIGQGISSTAQTLAFNANQTETKNKMNLLSGAAPAINNYIMANPDQAATFSYQLQSVIMNGTMADLENLMRTISGAASTGQPKTYTDLDNRG